jgi:hypothetical protein
MVAGCAGGDAGTAETSPTAVAAPTTLAAATTSPLPTTSVRDGTEVCAAFDAAEVEEVLGGPLLEPPRVDTMAPTCAFLVPAGIVYVRILTEDADTAATAAALYADETSRIAGFGADVEVVDGLGDEAALIELADGSDLVLVRSGPMVLNVAGEGIDADRLVAIAGLSSGVPGG